MIESLDIFDLDGTLFRNPLNNPKTIEAYEKATGIPWMIDKKLSRELTAKHKRFIPIRQGWHGRKETLEPPLVPNPAPAELFIQEAVVPFLESKKNPNRKTVIMTGRHAGLKNQVLRILSDGNLCQIERKTNKEGEVFYNSIDPDVEILLLGMDGPAPNLVGPKPSGSTLPWKFWIIDQFLALYPELPKLQIWEDREEHKVEFEGIAGAIKPELTVHYIDVWR